MPLDVLGPDTDPARRPQLFLEAAGSEFVPDVNHLAPDVVLLADGSLLAMAHVPGYPFELESMRARNTRRRQINDLIRGIADDNVTISVHLVHHDHVPPLEPPAFRSGFARRLFEKYRRNCLEGKLWSTDWFVSVVVSPRSSAARRLRRRLSLFGRSPDGAGEAVSRQISAIMQALMAYVGQDGGRRLGLRRSPEGYLCSEISEARRLILMGRWQPVPLTTGKLGDAIYTERVTCGTRAVRVDGLDGPRFAKTLALRDYPEETLTGQFSHLALLEVPGGPDRQPERFPFVLAQSFRFQGREEASTRLYLKKTRMLNAFDAQEEGIEDLHKARGVSSRARLCAGTTISG